MSCIWFAVFLTKLLMGNKGSESTAKGKNATIDTMQRFLVPTLYIFASKEPDALRIFKIALSSRVFHF